MKTYLLLLMVGLLSMGCNAQENQSKKIENTKSDNTLVEQPEGTWIVDKEFDENGNLIRYDSIYSWSSNGEYDKLSLNDKDSLMQSFKSRFFKNYSGFDGEGFSAVFSQDSLFANHFFNDDFFDSNFGNDLMDIDKLREQMMAREKKFLEKYQSEFIKPEPEDEN